MRKIIVGGIATALAASTALAMTAGAAPPSGPSVTGGGQIDVPTSGGGPGDTLSLEAHTVGSGQIQGNVQYTPHASSGTAQHGTVTCIGDTGPKQVTITGSWTEGATGTFKITIQDNGTGSSATPDAVGFTPNSSDTDCTKPVSPNADLGHGNYTVRNAT